MPAQRKLITFLGATQYQETCYCRPHPGMMPAEVRTPFVQEALAEFYQPDVVVAFLTPTARANRPKPNAPTDPPAEPFWNRLERILEAQTGRTVLSPAIPDNPQTEADVWEIFRRIQENVAEGDTLIFDITNAFRSIPVVALVAVSYLRLVCGVTIEALVYGAFVQGQDRTPIVDVLPIASLLDWTSAADQFLQTGVAQPLAGLVRPAAPALAENLSRISQGLELLRPYNVMQQAARLPDSVAQAETAIQASLPPLPALLDRVSADYRGFELDRPRQPHKRREVLLKQFALIEWYWGRKQVVHAVTMAREWLVTLLCLRLGLDPQQHPARQDMEALLNYKPPPPGDRQPPRSLPNYAEHWTRIPGGNEIRRIWQNERRDCRDCLGLADLRNSIAHAGQTGGLSEANLLRRAEDILEALRPLRDRAAAGHYDPLPEPLAAPPRHASPPGPASGGATIGEMLDAKGKRPPRR